MKIFIIIISLLLFSLSLSQNIITSWNYDKVSMYDIQKVNTFLTSFLQEPLDIPIEIKNDTLSIEKIKLISIQTNLYDSLINYNTGLLLFTPNKVTLCFNFSYTETKKGYKGDSTLELKLQNFKIKVKNDKDDPKSIFSIKMSATKEGYSIPGIQDKEFLNKLQSVLYSEFNKNSVLNEIISENLEIGISDYYTEFYKKNKEFRVYTNEFFGHMGFPMRNNKFMFFCEDILGQYKTAFCYYPGYTNLYDDHIDKTKVPLVNQNFSHNDDDLYNIFINYDMFKTIMDYITNNYFIYHAKIYNNETNTKKLSYDFTVASLQKYFNGLDNLNKKDTFYCQVYIQDITFDKVSFKVIFQIRNADKTNFSVNVTSSIRIDLPITKSVRFNLCLGKITTKKVEMIPGQINVDIKDLEGLQKAINESFDFKHNPICLNDEGISLRDYFAEINKAYLQPEGIYLEGKQLYQ